MAAGERAVADLGYRGEPLAIDLPYEGTRQTIAAMSRARMRHETCNRRFKYWACMNQSFRHGVAMHYECFASIAVLTQLGIENGQPLFETSLFL